MMTHVPSSVWKLRRRPYPFALSHPAPVCSHLVARRGAAVQGGGGWDGDEATRPLAPRHQRSRSAHGKKP